jgi:hypothetical protein
MTNQLFATIPFLILNQHLFNMLYRKIIAPVFYLIELLCGILILTLWTIAYPLLRLRYSIKKRFKYHPSLLLFKSFVWMTNKFKYDYFKK